VITISSGKPTRTGSSYFPVYDDDIAATSLLDKNYDRIIEAELQSRCRNLALWPSPRTSALIREWFEIRFYDLMDDLSREELKYLEVDEAFAKQIRHTL
jgi:hypothetical protein